MKKRFWFWTSFGQVLDKCPKRPIVQLPNTALQLVVGNAINILNIRLGQETDKNSIKDSKQLKEILITTEEWDLLESLVDVLEQFAEATDYLGGSTYCTYSIINPFIEQIKADLIE